MLHKFLKDQAIDNQWDLLLFGDGSGSQWKGTGGCCTFLIDGRMMIRRCLISAQSRATVNRMELRAYTDALGMHYYELLDGKLKDPPYNVWIFSDSEYTVKCGSREYGRKVNLDQWVVIDWFETRGYRIRWRWLPRNSNPLHTMADDLAGKSKDVIKSLVPSEETLYQLLPAIKPKEEEWDLDLVECEICYAPMLPTETKCPQCGRDRE